MNEALLVVNSLLVLVTGVYVILTGKISSANAKSAQTAVAVAMATVDATFDVKIALRRLVDEHDPSFQDKYYNLGVEISPAASNLMVHDVRIVNYSRATTPASKSERIEAEGPIRESLHWGTFQTPPVRMHKGQSRRLFSPSTWVPKDYVQRIDVEVDYSLDGNDVATYRTEWMASRYNFLNATSMRRSRAISQSQKWAELELM